MKVEVVDAGKGSHWGCALKGGTWGKERWKSQNGLQASTWYWGAAQSAWCPQSPLHAS